MQDPKPKKLSQRLVNYVLSDTIDALIIIVALILEGIKVYITKQFNLEEYIIDMGLLIAAKKSLVGFRKNTRKKK